MSQVPFRLVQCQQHAFFMLMVTNRIREISIFFFVFFMPLLSLLSFLPPFCLLVRIHLLALFFSTQDHFLTFLFRPSFFSSFNWLSIFSLIIIFQLLLSILYFCYTNKGRFHLFLCEGGGWVNWKQHLCLASYMCVYASSLSLHGIEEWILVTGLIISDKAINYWEIINSCLKLRKER